MAAHPLPGVRRLRKVQGRALPEPWFLGVGEVSMPLSAFGGPPPAAAEPGFLLSGHN